MVDTISGLGSLEYEHDAWGIDVSIAGSQKGHDAAAGPRFQCAVGKGAGRLESQHVDAVLLGLARHDRQQQQGSFPYTPATNLLYGLNVAVAMMEEEGLENVWARHKRQGAATRAAVKAWGLDLVCRDPHAYSPALTAVMVPDGHDADAFRKVVLENFDMSLGAGLNKLKGKAFRIGHLGHANDLMLMGALAGIEMGLGLAKVPHRAGGVAAAMDVLKGRDVAAMPKIAVA